MLKDVFIELLNKYSKRELIEKLWAEIEEAYTEEGRYYHNLEHLEFMYQNLLEVKEKINDFNTVLFGVQYLP